MGLRRNLQSAYLLIQQGSHIGKSHPAFFSMIQEDYNMRETDVPLEIDILSVLYGFERNSSVTCLNCCV